ncbi:MAG: transcriptional regulator, TetR family [Mycobacterium sp.]|jgi:TetR/AcrR family transcriptional repressor of nem operon|uniref:TetR/AcrR family transcriptional regulator n=1 Tax=Mycobacterium sp. TaxID=1785 RepID=UPI00261465BE|nr:TetR/AcrR family transcriptional regulator [Mycobacterium sp.]MCW2664390.1 transcriptional regulator, TetR family [Mycobacterium sp.]
MARPRKFVEDQVIEAARDQFWAHGYAGTSLDDLVAVTGLGRGSLYGAFGDKHTIFMRALDEYSVMTMAAVRAELRDSAESAYDRLVGHIRSMARANATDSKRRGCLTAKSAAELAATDKAVARRVRRFLDTYQTELAETIAAAQREGHLDAAVDSRDLAALVLALLRGMEALRKGEASSATITSAAEQAIALLPGA